MQVSQVQGGIAIQGVDTKTFELIGCDGKRYHELSDHTWVAAKFDDECVVRYVGSVNHGGGIRLNPLFVREGTDWVNVVTGSRHGESPSS